MAFTKQYRKTSISETTADQIRNKQLNHMIIVHGLSGMMIFVKTQNQGFYKLSPLNDQSLKSQAI